MEWYFTLNLFSFRDSSLGEKWTLNQLKIEYENIFHKWAGLTYLSHIYLWEKPSVSLISGLTNSVLTKPLS